MACPVHRVHGSTYYGYTNTYYGAGQTTEYEDSLVEVPPPTLATELLATLTEGRQSDVTIEVS